VVNAVNNHEMFVLNDFVDHSVCAAPSRVQSGKFSLQSTTDTLRILQQCAQHELNNRQRNRIGQAGKLSLCGTSDTQLERLRTTQRFGYLDRS
jgi:hypothetical protein